tara:strand:- start:1588 stop:1767 length:180 start_codon:yes stop_codon:yes gene_type:complete
MRVGDIVKIKNGDKKRIILVDGEIVGPSNDLRLVLFCRLAGMGDKKFFKDDLEIISENR